MSQQEYERSYPPESVYDESSFGEGGFVQSTVDGGLQVGVRHKDGIDVFADLDSPAEAQELRDAVDWAREVDVAARGDRPPDEATGLVDWKAAPSTGLIAGPRPDGQVAVAGEDGGHGIVLTHHEAGQLVEALDVQIDAAVEAGAE